MVVDATGWFKALSVLKVKVGYMHAIDEEIALAETGHVHRHHRAFRDSSSKFGTSHPKSGLGEQSTEYK